MSWKRRILELTLAGGMLAGGGVGAAGCGDDTTSPIPLCNANPDPCCASPSSQACIDYQHRDLSVSAHDLGAADMTPHD